MTDITELAQREKFEAWFKSSFHPDKTGPYMKDQLYFAWKAAGAELVEALEKAQQQIIALQQRHEVDPRTHEIIDLKERIDNLESFRTAYMEWGVKTDWVQGDKRFDVLKPWGKHRADVLRAYIEHLESRTVKLPKPHAHLIWIQAGHAPDDYWDDVAVSHSEKDRCCDGSERYPVYARWEIEGMLTAAGIKWEAE